MRIVSVSENLDIEKRIAITPEISKKYISLGLEVFLPENYGDHLGIKDKEYLEHGVKISKNDNEIINNADITLFNPEEQWVFSEKDILSKSKNSALLDCQLKGKVYGIIANKKMVLN